MEPNPEIRPKSVEQLTPMQKVISEMEAERDARRSELIVGWDPKDIAIGVTGGILFAATLVELASAIQDYLK